MKDMIMGFVNGGTKITISDDKVELTLTKDNILKCNDNMIVVKNGNMMSYMQWRDVTYFKF